MDSSSSSDESDFIYYTRRRNKLKLVCGPNSSIINYPEGQEDFYDNFINIRLERDLSMQRKAKHFIKLDIEVHVPAGFVAIVESLDNSLDFACSGEFIHHGSHNKRIIFFLENLSYRTIHLKKFDIVGKLRLFRLNMSFENYFPQIVVKN